jgi:outer membrane protein assembly factor BamB
MRTTSIVAVLLAGAGLVSVIAGCAPSGSLGAVSVKCRSTAAARGVNDAITEPAPSPPPALTAPHLVGTESLSGSQSAGPSQLYPDPADPRSVYEVGPAGLSKIDTATWQARWTTTIRVPQVSGSNGIYDWRPQLFRGYTQVAAGRRLPASGGAAALTLANQVTAAVSDAGKVLVSCTTSPVYSPAVLLPHAGILLLPGSSQMAAYSTTTGKLRWHAAATLYQVSGDTVYTSAADQGGRVAAYDALSGRRMWSVPVSRTGAVQTLTVADGIVYVNFYGFPVSVLLAVRARDGVLLWRRPVPSYSEPPVVEAATDGSLLVLGSAYAGNASAPMASTTTAQLVDGRRTGGLVASGHPGGYYAAGWQSWSARLGHPVVAAAGQSPFAGDYILTPKRGYPAGTAANSQLILAAVAQNVAYIISSQCSNQSVPSPPSRNVAVAGLDIRNGRTLWSVRLPPAIQCDAVPPLVPFDGGFAIVTLDNHVLLYR